MPVISAGLVARAAATYAGAALAGWLFSRLHVPLPWMLGPVVITAIASLSGLRVAGWAGLRSAGLIVVGTTLGLYFTPEAARQLLDHVPLILAAVFATVLIACAASLLLTRTSGIDRVTAFFCSVPGGPAEMCMLASRYGGEPVPIAVSQMLRIVVLVMVLPAALTFGGAGRGPAPAPEALTSLGLLELGLLLAGSTAATFAATRAGVRSAWLLVPLACAIAATLSGWAPPAMPSVLAAAAQVCIGTQLGLAFRRQELMAVRRALPAILLNVGILAAGCAAVAALLAVVSGASLAALVLATAPGGVTEMCLTARSLGLEVPLVVGFHICRVFIVVSATPWLFAAMRRIGLIELPHPLPDSSRGAHP
ncbi:Putative ammonia monooxygenase [Bordetella ansorpii]|uniref:Putative ammonia monooxygenase n=1 Tax=Bordetella ansorpii TaxID=288768 RepID=A0A157KC58_9BORD|nr:AbrB family transcriptional regulator [Bordetella ansorpii]SAH82117.1 Putative ammonia monooxygenase [Bordetella ansorpii]